MTTTLYSSFNSKFDINHLAESVEIECKLARGKDGNGAVPKSFWESYSAMANTYGGTILLGVEERKAGGFVWQGVKNHAKVIDDLWNTLRNKDKISINLLKEKDIRVIDENPDLPPLIAINIPQASRKAKPVYVGRNPLTGTYVRVNEGDYKTSEEDVRRMIAENVEDSRDERILENFDINDLDLESVTAYRNRFSAVKPGHVFLDLNMSDFLEKIGAYGVNRETGAKGLRAAGLLMFGNSNAIREVFPNYMVDYQERPEAKAERRWIDRIIPDGSWSGNLFDFFRKTYLKLTENTKTPFRLIEGQRIEDNAQSEALREALVNTLIHADFTGRISILIVKRPDMFGFRNPGRMRIPLEIAIHGGNSDCRNRRLQTMFQLVGYGDHAGSGIPKIFSNWESQQWRRPSLYELNEPEQTIMELRMEGLFPQAASDDLYKMYGEKFTELPDLERLILIAAAAEGTINHARIKALSTDHSVDISKALTALSRDGFLKTQGERRAMIYFLQDHEPSPKDTFAAPINSLQKSSNKNIEVEYEHNTESSGHNTESSGHNTESSGHSNTFDESNNSETKESLSKLASIQSSLKAKLNEHLKGSSLPKRMPPEQIRYLILLLCQEHHITLDQLALALERNKDSLRKNHINPLITEGLLIRLHKIRNHPQQAYKSAKP